MMALVTGAARQTDPITMFAMNSVLLRRNQSPFCNSRCSSICSYGCAPHSECRFGEVKQQASSLMQCAMQFDQISIHVSWLPLTFLNFSSVSTSRKDAPTKATTFARATPACMVAAAYNMLTKAGHSCIVAASTVAAKRWRSHPH